MGVSVDSIQRYIAAGNVYVGCWTPPAGRGFLEFATAGVPSGGIDVGATQGESTFNYKVTINSVDIEQSTTPVAPYVATEEATIEFTCLEATATLIKAALGSSSVSGSTVSPHVGSAIRFGGLTAVTGQCVAIVAEQPNNLGKYAGFMLYTAINDAGLSRSFKRGKETLVKFSFKSFPSSSDLLRTKGEQVGQYSEDF